jgi:hypothetical protein
MNNDEDILYFLENIERLEAALKESKNENPR